MEPFIRWVRSVDPLAEEDGVVAALGQQVSVYLVAEDPEGCEESAPIEGYFRRIFENELEEWFTDRSLWPINRDISTFQKWFDVSAESVVFDLERSPLNYEDF
jgi:hypothetical protein